MQHTAFQVWLYYLAFLVALRKVTSLWLVEIFPEVVAEMLLFPAAYISELESIIYPLKRGIKISWTTSKWWSKFMNCLSIIRKVKYIIQGCLVSWIQFMLWFWKRWPHSCLCLCEKDGRRHVCHPVQSLQAKTKFWQVLLFVNKIVLKQNCLWIGYHYSLRIFSKVVPTKE